ncbi:prolyl oligopeptidase family serine peptidase [Photobacterium sp. SDRW27]|uniref:prolyl oligopeptidase family serine peptidase n=1 Tax=Photobacterium obscurum TaxID=2829490 RepID=UPI002243F556|nr:prolyl oligopeptidase family serine peptidase [Photobacterium obscurum]MCW8332171.1 prolyl oligopeptidase family serine peptidase [Photobacterium obscurum]
MVSITLLASLHVGAAESVSVLSEPELADNYQWLRDDSRQSERVLSFLRQENLYTANSLQPQAKLAEELLDEWKQRAVKRGQQPWLLRGDYNYRIESVQGVRQLNRQQASSGQVLTVVNLTERAAAASYYQLAAWAESPDHRYVALAEDRRGDRNYQIAIVDTQSGKVTESIVANGSTDLVWSQDSKNLYLVENEAETYRPYRVLRYQLSSGLKTALYQEKNLAWLVSVYKATSGNYGIVQSNNHNTSEQQLIELDSGTLLGTIRPRESGIEYYADVQADNLYLSSNIDGSMALYQAQLGDTKSPWQPLWRPSAGQHLKNWLLYQQAIVLEVSHKQNSDVVVLDYQGKIRYQLPITPEGGVAWLSRNGWSQSPTVRIRSMSMAQPPQWLELDLQSYQLKVLSEDRYPNLEPSLYRSEQLMVKTGEVSVPVSLVYRPDRLTQNSAVLLYGYGAYGTPMRPYFMAQVMSLLDRGMIYAIAHVRGGGYLGPDWYLEGKGLNKPNSIADFVAVADVLTLFKQGRQRPILAMGGSAGGTLVAAALNQRPELFAGAVLQVPFVDVINTMADPSLPLTRQEYAEWGDPSKPEQFAVMETYSPYDNIKDQAYPPMLVTAGLFDSQVPYWEAAKWVAKLREHSSLPGPYLLETNMEGGHMQDPRRASQQQAKEYAFLLTLAQKASASP